MKKLIFIFVLFISTRILGEEIKLSCNLNLVRNFSSGYSEKENITDIIEVSIHPRGKFILPKVLSSVHVLEPEVDPNYSAIDQSDLNKWEISITNRRGTKEISSVQTRFFIDRNSGLITYDSTTNFFNGDWLMTTGNGNCSKVDLTKKKF